MPNAVHDIRYRVNRHTCRLINASLKIIFAKTKWDILNLNAPIRLYISDYKLLFRCKAKDYKMAVSKYGTLRPWNINENSLHLPLDNI